MNTVQKAFYRGEDHENCYLFSPSMKQAEICGQTDLLRPQIFLRR